MVKDVLFEDLYVRNEGRVKGRGYEGIVPWEIGAHHVLTKLKIKIGEEEGIACQVWLWSRPILVGYGLQGVLTIVT